ncbi:hypothetical protein FRC00_004362 [Tulasnella sp. 408]|nr:hypothetical protein FRC00_004362 [Tulasnella sp. 408]
MSNKHATLLNEGQNSELLASPLDQVADAIVNDSAVIFVGSTPDANAPPAPRPLTPSSTAKRVSTVPRARQLQRAATPDTVWNYDSGDSKQAGAPSSTGSRQTARAPLSRPHNSTSSSDSSVSSPTSLDVSKHSAGSGTSDQNVNSQAEPQNVPLEHNSSLAVAHSSHSTPSSRPQDRAAELSTDPAPSSHPTHVVTSNEGAIAVPHGLDVSIRSVTSSRGRGRAPAQASSSRPQRALVPKRPTQALLGEEEPHDLEDADSTGTDCAPSGGGRDVPNDQDYISDTETSPLPSPPSTTTRASVEAILPVTAASAAAGPTTPRKDKGKLNAVATTSAKTLAPAAGLASNPRQPRRPKNPVVEPETDETTVQNTDFQLSELDGLHLAQQIAGALRYRADKEAHVAGIQAFQAAELRRKAEVELETVQLELEKAQMELQQAQMENRTAELYVEFLKLAISASKEGVTLPDNIHELASQSTKQQQQRPDERMDAN